MSKEKPVTIGAPPYANFSEAEREAFLSQLGNFTPYQRTIFHELCKNRQGEIPYRSFAERMSLQVKNVDSEIDGLISKLNSHKMALFRFSYDSGEKDKQRKLRSIILTDQGDWIFYLFTFQQLLDDISNGLSPRLPIDSVLEEAGLQFPNYMVTEIKKDQFRKPYIEKTFPEPAILKIALKDDEYIYIYSKGINHLIQLCITVIKDITESNNVLSELARFKNTTLSKIRDNLKTRAPGVWLDITKTILEFDQQHTQKQLTISRDLFISADVVYHYLKNEIEDAKQKKDQDRQVDSDLRAIVEKIKKKYFEPITQEQLNGEIGVLKEKYGALFEEVKDQFFDQYTKTKDRIKLPPIVFLDQKYIHRNNLHKFSAYQFKDLGEELDQHYIALMREVLRTNNRTNTVVFHSIKNFNIDLEERVKDSNHFIAELLERPRLLAEGIIHVAKDERQVKEIEQVKHILELYFLPGTMRYRSLSDIFKLNIYNIYTRAYNLLPILRQMWMKLTGKHRTFKDKYTQYRAKSIPQAETRDDRGVSSGGSGAKSRRRVDNEKIHSESYGRRKSGSTIADLHAQRADKPKPKPQYSKKQTNQAWDEFRDSLKK